MTHKCQGENRRAVSTQQTVEGDGPSLRATKKPEIVEDLRQLGSVCSSGLDSHQFRYATHAQPTRLRQIIAERGHYHVLLGVRSAAYTSPDITNDVGELWTPLHSSFRSVIELVVE